MQHCTRTGDAEEDQEKLGQDPQEGHHLVAGRQGLVREGHRSGAQSRHGVGLRRGEGEYGSCARRGVVRR